MILSFLVLSGCNMNENSFNYDRGNACIIDYGRNGISVIVDGDNILVKNNRAIIARETLKIVGENKRFSTIGKYFIKSEANDIVNEMINSEELFLKWNVNGGRSTQQVRARNIINVSDFESRLKSCKETQITGEN